MKTFDGFNISAIVAALMVVAIAYVLVPQDGWTNISIVTGAAFALSAGFVFFVPSLLRKRQAATDAAQMAAVGPLGVLTMLLLLLSGAAFIAALAGSPKLALVLLILGAGSFLIAWNSLSAALNVVDATSSVQSRTSNHVVWQGQLSVLASILPAGAGKTKLEALGEKLRYAASDIAGGAPQDAQLAATLDAMSGRLAADKGADLASEIGTLELLIAQRETFLRSARSKA